ncbi:N-acetyltransferase [Cryobacterium suzukii]|uniref:N-acetyltransferase n=1 Tax=Cryobacterium suzukii TaxID=1259198 RepID=A0A4R9AIG0_9MICO|nr:GNAT family N-acetyltransferase [Cryobacterium suzukii]TFD62743.1 N-acetyltransferase [Cryobacterium suzukii]
MDVTLVPISSARDRDALIRFLTENDFPFHVGTRLTVQDAQERIAGGRFEGPDHAGFWIDAGTAGRVGYAVLDDLADNAPLFDLRLATQYRGQGLGVPVLRALTNYVFTHIPEASRFEGNTRSDNIAMRKSFRRAGFIQEACYRDGWPVSGAAPMASVAYAILRRDWESGTTTPLEWDDPAGL